MSDWHEYWKEKQLIDEFLAGGYVAVEFAETLDGDLVRFEKASGGEKLAVLFRNADARKYLGSVLIDRLGDVS